jgi:hypothetical protein
VFRAVERADFSGLAVVVFVVLAGAFEAIVLLTS